MKLVIVYGEISGTHQLLIDRAEDLFDSVLAAPIEGLKFVHGEEEGVYYKGTDLTDFDAAYIRVSDRDQLFGEHLVEMFNESGMATHCESDAYAYESNKFYSMKALAEAGVNVPDSYYTVSPEKAVEAAERVGYPVIMKTVNGGAGEGVMKASGEGELKPVMDTMNSLGQDIVIQEFHEDATTDTRVIVVGDTVTGYLRIGGGGEEWRSNIHMDGERGETEIDEETRQTGLKAARSTGFDICGIDVVGDENTVLEVNGAFGLFENMEEIAGEDIPLEIVERLHEKALEN